MNMTMLDERGEVLLDGDGWDMYDYADVDGASSLIVEGTWKPVAQVPGQVTLMPVKYSSSELDFLPVPDDAFTVQIKTVD